MSEAGTRTEAAEGRQERQDSEQRITMSITMSPQTIARIIRIRGEAQLVSPMSSAGRCSPAGIRFCKLTLFCVGTKMAMIFSKTWGIYFTETKRTLLGRRWFSVRLENLTLIYKFAWRRRRWFSVGLEDLNTFASINDLRAEGGDVNDFQRGLIWRLLILLIIFSTCD
jgi:hypothetical protein